MTDLNPESLRRAATKALHMATGLSWERVHQSVRDGYLNTVREVIREWTAAEAERGCFLIQTMWDGPSRPAEGVLRDLVAKSCAAKDPAHD